MAHDPASNTCADAPAGPSPPPPRQSAFAKLAAALRSAGPREPPPSLVPRRAPLSRRPSTGSSSGGSFGSRRNSSTGCGGSGDGVALVPVAAAAATITAALKPLPPAPPATAASAAAAAAVAVAVAPAQTTTTTTTAWWLALNVASSVAIVFVNKKALSAFPRPVALSALHFFACGAALFFCGGRGRGGAAKQQSPRPPPAAAAALRVSVLGALSVAALNLSLRGNSVGVFQASKLLIAPAVALIEAAIGAVVSAPGSSSSSNSARKSTPPSFSAAPLLLLALSLAATTAGALLVGAADRERLSVPGLAAAGAAVVFSALQQVATAAAQQQHQHPQPALPTPSSARLLLARSAPIQGALLLALSPLLDPRLSGGGGSGSGPASLSPSSSSPWWLAASAALACAVNLSQYRCLATMRASTFAAASNVKALAVLAGAARGSASAPASALGSAGAALSVAGAAGWTSALAQKRRRCRSRGQAEEPPAVEDATCWCTVARAPAPRPFAPAAPPFAGKEKAA